MIYSPKISSFDTNWLSRKHKQLPACKIIFTDEIRVGGYYVQNPRKERYVESIPVYPGSDYIIIGHDCDRLPLESIIAHEFRHHWQFMNGWKYDGLGWAGTKDYDKEITNYFHYSFSEIDALLYEIKLFPCPHSVNVLNMCRERFG